MKRLTLAVLAVASVLAPSATAGAETQSYRGLEAQPRVGFVAKIVNGDVVSVKKFTFYDIALACDLGQTPVVDNDGSPLPKMIVNNNGRFGDTFTSNNGQSVKVSGKFTSNKRAEGTLRITGDFIDQAGGALTNCDSGKVQWVAK